ncbi:hypothetical protein OK349_06130 [Sphingomonas sp. BT-65]|uniref:hypothetical protein n=1 Tax=Sphingomonas sp. BT-65 TaxID=2989821 RepID=UPI002235A7F1|nr:hypothetical protein [Sphingomonas sp. BT-65]MCW4461277.1 hypothetical protein [Sphingomonas sp. BT-65]
MHIAGDGGSVSPTNSAPPACTAGDPQVQEAVDQTVAATEFGQPNDGAQAAYQISETLARTDLTQEQKDEYIAAIVQMAGGQSTLCGSVDERTADKLRTGLNDIGTAWTDPATPELRDQVTDSIARGVADGRLDADDLYGIVSEPGSAGTRQLLTDVRDGNALAAVADRLAGDARAQGYDINDHQTGPETLTAAADIANMAAANGNRSAANAVLAEISRVEARGPVAGDDMTLTQAMMATTVGGGQWNNLYERDGFHALSGLLNSVSQTPANQPAQDKLFGDLVRSGGEGYVGGIDEGGNRGPALDQLGMYFDRNVGRLSETDWRMDNTGDPHHGLVQDFMRNVMLDPDYGRAAQTQDALTNEMTRLAVQVGDTSLPPETRENAASTLGAMMGSLQQAGADYIANAEGDAEAKVAFVRQFTDIITDKLIGKLGERLPEGDIQDGATGAANNFVDALWQKLVDHQTQAARDHVDETTGGLLDLSQTIRTTMATGEASLLNAFDLRVELYFDH